MKNIFILLPSPNPSGPIKGAYAIANQIIKKNKVYIVFLKNGSGVESFLSDEVKIVDLSQHKNWINKFLKFKNFIKRFDDTVIISMCFSADLFNLFLNRKFYKISSIRGNLFKNYFFEYGFIGIFPAFLQLYIQKYFDKSFSMNTSMSSMIKKISGINSIIIPNFIDEDAMKRYFHLKRNVCLPFKFIFIGQLTKRKNPILLIKSFYKLLPLNASLDIVGDGPLYDDCLSLIKELNLTKHVNMHSFLDNPFEILSKADVFVLPSYSEGTSRAMLEALFLGVRCVLRDVDSNYEIINEENGILFNHDEELSFAMLKAAIISQKNPNRKNLLPERNRQIYVQNLYNRILKIKS